VLDNSQVFSSNQPKPEFILRHIHGKAMMINKLTIRSQEQMKCGAQPVGRGLVFFANRLTDFELTKPFHDFTFT
jgi:hypothetical protein